MKWISNSAFMDKSIHKADSSGNLENLLYVVITNGVLDS